MTGDDFVFHTRRMTRAEFDAEFKPQPYQEAAIKALEAGRRVVFQSGRRFGLETLRAAARELTARRVERHGDDWFLQVHRDYGEDLKQELAKWVPASEYAGKAFPGEIGRIDDGFRFITSRLEFRPDVGHQVDWRGRRIPFVARPTPVRLPHEVRHTFRRKPVVLAIELLLHRDPGTAWYALHRWGIYL